VEYTTIGQAALEIDGVEEESAEQSQLPTEDDDVEVDDAEVDDDGDVDDEVTLRFRSINDIMGTVGFASCALVPEELHVVSFNELTPFVKAERSPNWRKVMMEVMMEEMTMKSLRWWLC
jgi:hypothetical protein